MAIRHVMIGVIVAVLATATASAGAAANPAWITESVPSPPARTGDLDAISCVTSVDCMAVGTYVDEHGLARADSRHWDGATWTRLTTPTPPGATDVQLSGVSCPAVDDCLAVGAYAYDRTDARKTWGVRWDGTSWHPFSTPNPALSGSTPDRVLTDIACGSPTSCLAVGFVDGDAGTAPLAARWNGTAWSLATPPDVRGDLTAVSCPAADQCIVLAATVSKAGAAEYLNGTWTTLPAPNHYGIGSLSCVSLTLCMSTGFGGARSAVQVWDGAGWHKAAAPDYPNAIATDLAGVSCASATRCTVVGDAVDPHSRTNGHSIAIALRWNGTVWSLSSVPRSEAPSATLDAVSCAAIGHCVAVGYTDATADFNTPPAGLAASWDSGSGWTLHDAADRHGTSTGALHSISCTDDQKCMAVGEQLDGKGRMVSLSERRTAHGWSRVPVPDEAAPNELEALSCSSSGACLAVGMKNTTDALVVRWNGSKWTTVAPPSDPVVLADVTCVAAGRCVAVGRADVAGNDVGAIETWNGSTWSGTQLSVPDGAFSAELNGVTCQSQASCTAVGSAQYEQEFGYVSRPIQAWFHNGTWSITGDATVEATLNAVTCTSPASCVAVGASGKVRAFAETWDGSSWSVVSPPSPPQLKNTSLNDISCVSSTRCVAVGWASGVVNPKYFGATLVEAWDGSGWTVESADNSTGATSPQLRGVSCVASGGCGAAGDTGSPWPVPLVESAQ